MPGLHIRSGCGLAVGAGADDAGVVGEAGAVAGNVVSRDLQACLRQRDPTEDTAVLGAFLDLVDLAVV